MTVPCPDCVTGVEGVVPNERISDSQEIVDASLSIVGAPNKNEACRKKRLASRRKKSTRLSSGSVRPDKKGADQMPQGRWRRMTMTRRRSKMSDRASEDACRRKHMSVHAKEISHRPWEISDGKKLPTALRRNGLRGRAEALRYCRA